MKAAIGALILVAGLCVGVMIRADEAPSASTSGPVVTPLERPADHTIRLEYPNSVKASVGPTTTNGDPVSDSQSGKSNLFAKFRKSEASLPTAPEPSELNRPARLPPVYAAKPSVPEGDAGADGGFAKLDAAAAQPNTTAAQTNSAAAPAEAGKEKVSPWRPIQAAFKQMTAPIGGANPASTAQLATQPNTVQPGSLPPGSLPPGAMQSPRGRYAPPATTGTAPAGSLPRGNGSSVMSTTPAAPGTVPSEIPSVKLEAMPPWKTVPAGTLPPEFLAGEGGPPPGYGGYEGGPRVPKSSCGYCSPTPAYGCCTCQSVKSGGPGCNCGSNGVCANCGGTCGGEGGGCNGGCNGGDNCGGGQPSDRINGNGVGITGIPAYGSCFFERLACCLCRPYPDCSNGCVDFCHSWLFHEDCHWCTSNHKCCNAGCPEYPHGNCASGPNGCGCGCAQCVPPPDWYFTADAFIVTRNNEAFNQPLALSGGDTLLSTGDMDFAYEVGPNLTLGYRPTPWDAWEVTYFGAMDWDSRTSLTGAADLNLPGALGAALDLNFANADAMNITYSSVIQNGEFNYLWTKGQIMWLLGFRYFHLGEEFDILSTGAGGSSAYDVTTSNDLYGGQLGARYRGGWRRFNWDFFGKAGVFGNRSVQDQTVSNLGGITVRDTHVTRGNTAFVGDIGVNLTYSFGKCWSVRGGYNALWVEDVALAPNQLDFTDTLTSGTTINTNGGVFYHGAHAGIGCHW